MLPDALFHHQTTTIMAEDNNESLASPAGPASSIRAIDRGSVHRICSGQVVLSLATAVKELVENSVDAGANNIEVRLKEYGSELIEVIDNGHGVEEANFAGLTLKHHTSKLRDFSDLTSVDTFGFRGEALSSLCALSKLSVVTCHKDSAIGAKLVYDHNGTLVSNTPCPRQRGTTITLGNLFSTMPVRHREFLRHLKREYSKMVNVLSAYCLISTNVRITCTNQCGKGKKSQVVSTNGNDSIKQNITNVFGAKQVQSIVEFSQHCPTAEVCEEFGIKPPDHEQQVFSIHGYISSAVHGQGRSTADRQFYFINRRPCDFAKVSRVVNEVYHSYNRHQSPFVLLDISLDKESVDVNVTPDKRQIFLEHEKLLLAIIKMSLVRVLEPHASLFTINQAQGAAVTSNQRLSASPLKKHASAPAGSSSLPTLANLKRSFSSAFAKEQPQDRTPKQRRLDSFVRRDSSPSSCPTPSPSSIKSGNLLNSFKRGVSSINLNQSKDTIDHSQLNESNKEDETQKASDSSEHTGSDIVTERSHLKSPSKKDSDIGCDSLVKRHNRSESEGGLVIHVENANSISVNKEYENKTVSSLQCSTAFDIEVDLEKDQTSGHSNVCVDTSQCSKEDIEQNDTSFTTNCSVEYVENEDDKAQFEFEKGKQDIVLDVVCIPKDSKIDEKDFSDVNVDSIVDSKPQNPVRLTVTRVDQAESVEKRQVKVKFSMDRLRNTINTRRKESSENKGWCRSFRAKINPNDNQSAEEELQREISKAMFPEMRIIGQFNLGFIITRLGQDLFIVDQHATDEKYNFEQLQQHTVIQSQNLISPQSLDLTVANETILLEHLPIFRQSGFEFAVDESAPCSQKARLVAVPVSKNWTFGKEDVDELIFMLSDTPGVVCRPSRVRMMFASRACRKSIMVGTALNQQQMRKVIDHMGEIEQPWNCPHGRPTMRHLINLGMLPQ